MRAARPAQGAAGGALFGTYPAPGLGAPVAAGAALFDDFLSQEFGTARGSLGWDLSGIAGVGATMQAVASVTADEFGVSRLTSPAQVNRGATLNMGSAPVGITQWVEGQAWTAKVRVGAALTDQDAWSGLAGSLTASVRTADATPFIGVRYDAVAGPNWYGVVKSAAGEDVVDLGVAAGTAWLRAGWRATAAGVQFFSWSWVSGLGWRTVDVGSPIARQPGANLGPVAIGSVSRAASARTIDVDLWSFCGAWPR